MGSGSSGIKCIKYLLFSFNFVFWLAGLAAVGIGVWIFVDPGAYDRFLGDFSFKIPSALLMAAGSVVMLVGFCGCVGAIRESRCLLGTFFTMLLLIFCAEVAAGVLGFLFRDKIEEEVTKNNLAIIKNEYGTGDHKLDFDVDTLQQNLKCCGAVGPSDYMNSAWQSRRTAGGKVPQSCCKTPSSKLCVISAGTPPDSEIFQTGCKDEIKKYAKDHMIYIAGAAIGIGCIQLLGMIFACCLFFSIESY